jgi:cellulose synthase/poly-beta-1,6-N-acetylglucosamine synthase-like glycosyltransferase
MVPDFVPTTEGQSLIGLLSCPLRPLRGAALAHSISHMSPLFVCDFVHSVTALLLGGAAAGSFDEVRVWTAALSDSDISNGALYNQWALSNLQLYFPFSEFVGLIFVHLLSAAV